MHGPSQGRTFCLFLVGAEVRADTSSQRSDFISKLGWMQKEKKKPPKEEDSDTHSCIVIFVLPEKQSASEWLETCVRL